MTASSKVVCYVVINITESPIKSKPKIHDYDVRIFVVRRTVHDAYTPNA